jgi:hypothetical protein
MEYLNQLNPLQIKITLLTLIVVMNFSSCKKDEIKAPPIGSLTLVNAVAGGKSVKMGSYVLATGVNNYNQFGLAVGENDLYLWPTGDSANPYFTYSKFTVQQGEAYSLFLGGIPTAVDGILIKENIPYRTDSTAGIRFINLVSNSSPLNITFSTSASTNEVSNLAYKQYTDFISYPSLYNSTYTFQVRAANNPSTVLTSFTFSTSSVPRFANVTLVIRGIVGATPIVGVTMVKHDR